MHKVLDGLGNFDEATLFRESGRVTGANLRLYNPETCEWAIYWASAAGASNLFPPMVGRFAGGQGTFHAFELVAGQHVHTRTIWTVLDGDSCRWEQAFSANGGQSWETNWICDFTREVD